MTMTKHELMMKEIVCKYHPDFMNNKGMKKFAMENSRLFDIERLVELTLAHTGGLEFVDAAGYDYDDMSDSKTTSVNTITNTVEVMGVENKIGALRICIYNPKISRIYYMFIPAADVPSVRRRCFGVNDHKQRLRFKWSGQYTDHYNSFEQYRISDFVTMSLKR